MPKFTHPLIRRFTEGMKLQNLRPATIKAYARYVELFQEFLGKTTLASFSREDLRRYLLSLVQERGLSPSSVNAHHMAIRKFCSVVMRRDLEFIRIPMCRRRRRLPVVLSRREIEAILHATRNQKHRTMLMTTYSAGLRASETVRLRLEDIDSVRMRLLVHEGKGGDSRHVMLSTRLLRCLREYWRQYRPRVWLFPGTKRPHMSKDGISRIFREAGSGPVSASRPPFTVCVTASRPTCSRPGRRCRTSRSFSAIEVSRAR